MATGRIGITPTLGTRWSKAPAGGTTSLSGLDDNSVALVYSVGYEQVYRNGVLLSRGNDYTATTGNSITLIDATIAGDIIEVFANELVPLTDAISKGQFTAKGALLSATAASTPGVLTVGSNDQVLTADSSTSTGLKWGTVSSNSFTQIATGSLSGASVDITSIPGTYQNLVLYLIDIYPATDNTHLRVRMNSIATNYHGFVGRTEGSFSGVTLTQTTDFYDDGTNFDNTDKDNHIILEFPNYTASARKLCRWNFTITAPDGTSKSTGLGTSSNSSTAAISSIQISFDSGNISGGTYYLYGVK